jgi:hypothetical protein
MLFRTKMTMDDTITVIAKHSIGVTWNEDSAGLALILTSDGYALTASPESHEAETLPERVLIAKDDGSPMDDGHELTRGERERAVRAILCGTLDRRTATVPFPPGPSLALVRSDGKG